MGKIKNKSPNKNIYRALEIALHSNQALIVHADQKAHILIQVNAIMVSILTTLTLRLPAGQRWLLLPFAEQLISCLVVIVLCAIVTRPRVSPEKKEPSSGKYGPMNPFVFTTYGKLKVEECFEGMTEFLGQPQLHYRNLLGAVHIQAAALSAKYKYLRLAYLIFITGLGLTLLSSLVILLYWI